MAYENLCMYCFEDHGGQDTCPHCGRDARAAVPQIQLLPGTLLHSGRFLVGRAMGQDAGGIVYMAYDTRRQAKLRIREYLPRDSARRLNDGSVVPAAGAEAAFEQGLSRLKASVEAVEDPKKRHFFFEENGTGYIAQRKSSAAAAAAAEDERPGRSTLQWLLIAGTAMAVVAAVVLLVIKLIPSFDATVPVSSPAPSSDALWMPEVTPSPTPFVAGTYAPIKDPELSWMDYTYGGNVNADYDSQNSNAKSTVKPTGTPRPTSQVVNSGSSSADITNLQWQLIELGWLNASKPSGKYDSATKAAVRDFQQYMNSTYAIDPKLSVDGIAGPATLYWLDQYSVSRKPTPTPTLPVRVTPTPGGTVVNESSSKQAIQYVQQKLIVLGMLSGDSDDGVYGSKTRGGVWEFQARVNQLLGREVLPVTGEVDPLTMSYLQYYADWWQQNKPSPTPTVTPTPTPEPTEGTTVDANSPRESILYVQQQLMALKFLERADGVYGPSTVQAVKNFQIRVNELQERDVLSITGACDQVTLSYLEYYVDLVNSQTTPPVSASPTPTPTETPTASPKPTLEPTESPTPDPDDGGDEDEQIVVDKNSPRESIEFVQQMLVELDLLDSADGIFGNDTVNALRAFQQLVNATEGREVLTAGGQGDMRTMQYLESYYEQSLASRTEKPTEAPTQTPPPLGQVGTPVVSYGEAASFDSGVAYVRSDFRITWDAEGDVDAYRVAITGSDGKQYADQKTEKTSLDVKASSLEAGVIYEISVSAIPVNGSDTDAATTVSYFALAAAATEVPTEVPTEAPTPTPSPSPTPAPEVGTVSAPAIDIGNVGYVENGVNFVSGDTRLSWRADGDLDSYFVRISDSNGKEITNTQTDREYVDISASDLKDGVTYTIQVGALPINGTKDDVVVASASFALAPRPTEAPTATPTPAPEVGTVSAPAIDIGNVGYVENGVNFVSGDTRLSWHADGDLDSYFVRISDSNGKEIANSQTDREYVDISASDLKDGVTYTIQVGALPINGTKDDVVVASASFALAPEPTDEPTDKPTQSPQSPSTVDSSTDAEFVLEMQLKLYDLGFLVADEDPQRGVYDEATRNAVLRFQQSYNEWNGGAPLVEIDPADPNAVVDATTLSVLMNS